MKKRSWLISFLLCAQVFSVRALEPPIAAETGFSGFLALGASSVQFASNTVAGLSYKSVAEANIDSFDHKPDKRDSNSFSVKGELTYTFAEYRSELFLGSALKDLIQYDFTTKAGLRQGLQGWGIVSVAYLFSAIPSAIWRDPFVVGRGRKETDRASNGLRLGWHYIAETPLSLELSRRNIRIDDEWSGRDLLLTGQINTADKHLLDREGTQAVAKVSWLLRFAKHHSVEPELKWVHYDLEGKAVSHELTEVGLSYTYHSQQYSVATTLKYGRAGYDAVNPVFATQNASSSLGFALTASKNQLFTIKPLSLLVSLAAGRLDADIDFYDSDMTMVTVGFLYRY